MHAPPLLAALLTLATGASLAQGEKEARALLEAMEAKLQAATSVHVKSQTLVGQGDLYSVFEGETWVGRGGRFQLAVKTFLGPSGGPYAATLTGDGREVRIQEDDAGRASEQVAPLPQDLDGLLRRGAARVSILTGFLPFQGSLSGEPQPEPLPLTNLRLGPKERDGGRAFRVVEYTTECANRWFEFVGPDRPIAVRLWIDTATGLPAKRRVDLAGGAWFEESYGLFELDVELPPALRAPAPAPEPQPEPEPEPEPAPAAGRRWF